MPDSIKIQPVSQPIRATVRLPGSKSITNRAIVCAALADGVSTLRGALDSEDTRVMIAGLRNLGIDVKVSDGGKTLAVTGCAGRIPASKAEIFVENSGTTIRFLTALVTLGDGTFVLDGIERMRERPIGDLAHALQQLGGNVSCNGARDCPPVRVLAKGLSGGLTSVNGGISSQYLSGLMMAAPCAEQDVNIEVAGTLVSVPYVAMTIAVMQAFRAQVHAAEDFSELVVSASGYQPADYEIEPDASAASYFWAAAAVTGGEITVTGLSKESLQGDVAFVECLRQMGCEVNYQPDAVKVIGKPLKAIEVDMNAISDTVQTLSVVALFAEGTTKIRNVGHIRHKETDRIAAVANELRKFGATVTEHDAGIDITPPPANQIEVLRPATIDTYNDHRMAMSFAIAGLVSPGVVINDPGCTVKTYPDFFDDLQSLVSG